MYIQGVLGIYVGLYKANFMKGMPKNKWYFTGNSIHEVVQKMTAAIELA